MSKHLIIARYNENVEWINMFINDNFTVYLYNKGPDNIDENIINNQNVIYEKLPNVGRESHTYLYHIIKYREHIADYNIFSQANPFDHLIKKQITTPEYFYNKVKEHIKTNINTDFFAFGAKNYTWWVGLGGKRNDILIHLHNKLFTNEFNNEYKFNNGGIFAVKKDAILNRSTDFYNTIINTSLNHHINPPEGFVLERMWVLLFDKNYIAKI